MDKFDDFDESVVSKPNRRRKLESKTHATEMGLPPPSGVHELSRKEKERLEKKNLKEFMKKS